MTTGYFIKHKYDSSFRQITWYSVRNLMLPNPRYTVIDENVSYYCYDEYIIKVIHRQED